DAVFSFVAPLAGLVAAWLASRCCGSGDRGVAAAVGALPCRWPAAAALVPVRRHTRARSRVCLPGDVDLAGGSVAAFAGLAMAWCRNDGGRGWPLRRA